MTLLPGIMMAQVNFLSKALTNWPITLNKVTDGLLAAVLAETMKEIYGSMCGLPLFRIR
jgi:hypothetical protein